MEIAMSVVLMARTCEVSEEPHAASGPALNLSVLVLSVARWIAREFKTRRDMRQLAEFDDHMLHDIGIVRADIEGAVRRGRGGPCTDARSFGSIDPAPSVFPLT